VNEAPSPASDPTPPKTRLGRISRRSRLREAGTVGKILYTWNRVAPFFVSAALFLSGFFAVFSPLPFLILGVTMSGWWLLLAILTNSSLVYFTSGSTVFQFYLLSIAAIGLVMPVLIRKRLKPEQIVARTWIAQWCVVGILILTYALIHKVTPFEELKRIFSEFFDVLLASLTPEARDQLVTNFGGGDAGIEEWRKRTLLELPGALGILCLILTWFNFRILVTLNPDRFLQRVGLDRRVLNRWKNADWLVWPTLGSWAVVLFADGLASDVALNVFKVLMAAYGLQGLAVLGAVFQAWKIRGIFRIAIYSLVILVMMPLLLSIGFFDQWFDFRAKLRQS
jgi:hypothetical protein